jgi:hypothetical protein
MGDMTQKLQKVIEKLRSLPEDKQDQIAGFVLHELEENARWEATTAKHRGKVAKLVEQILNDEKHGRTEELDPESL